MLVFLSRNFSLRCSASVQMKAQKNSTFVVESLPRTFSAYSRLSLPLAGRGGGSPTQGNRYKNHHGEREQQNRKFGEHHLEKQTSLAVNSVCWNGRSIY